MLGGTLAPLLRASAPVLVHGHQKEADIHADVTDACQANTLLENVRPAAIINLAGHTDVDTCESQPNQAYRLNVRIAENLASWISQQDYQPAFIHISTDQLYDGEGPHAEDDVTLCNTYALTKYAGELAALRVPCTVLRTNFFGPSRCRGRASFTDWLLAGLRDGKPLKVFDNVRFSPLSMTTLSRAISSVLCSPVKGVFNLGARDGMSKADFAFAFAQALDLPSKCMERTTTDRVDFLKTYRPMDMRLDSTAFEETFKMRLPLLAQELKATCEEYQSEPSRDTP